MKEFVPSYPRTRLIDILPDDNQSFLQELGLDKGYLVEGYQASQPPAYSHIHDPTLMTHFLCLGRVYRQEISGKKPGRQSTRLYVFMDVACTDKPVYMVLYRFDAEGIFMKTCKNPFHPGETMTGSVNDDDPDCWKILPSIQDWPCDADVDVVPRDKIEDILKNQSGNATLKFTDPHLQNLAIIIEED